MLAECVKQKEKANFLTKTRMIGALKTYEPSIRIILKEVPKYAFNEGECLLECKIKSLFREIGNKALKRLSACFSDCTLMRMKSKEHLEALYFARFSVWYYLNGIKPKLRLATTKVENMELDVTKKFLNELLH